MAPPRCVTTSGIVTARSGGLSRCTPTKAPPPSRTLRFTPLAASNLTVSIFRPPSSSVRLIVAADGLPAEMPVGSGPNPSVTLSRSSSSPSSVAVTVKVCRVSLAPKVTLPGTPA